jgi:Skp family chaperone for outer membrane proteins
MMKTALYMVCSIAVVAIVAAGAVKTTPPAHPVGFYDVERVTKQSKVVRAAMEAGTRNVQPLLARAQKAAAEYDQSQKTPLSADAVTAKKIAADETAAEYKQASTEAQKKIDDQIAAAVAKVGAERKMSLVFAASGKPPYASPDADLTDAVVAAVDHESVELVVARARVTELEAKERK